jgi:hypothetical protein
LRVENCSATRRRVVVLKERDVEKGLYRQRDGRVFENLTSSDGDEKGERGKQSWEATAILKGIGASIFVGDLSRFNSVIDTDDFDIRSVTGLLKSLIMHQLRNLEYSQKLRNLVHPHVAKFLLSNYNVKVRLHRIGIKV